MSAINQALFPFAEEWVRRIRLNLGVVRKRKGYRNTWKKSGSAWILTGSKVRFFRSNSVASGNLQRGVKAKVAKGKIQIIEPFYGEYVEKGRGKNGRRPPSTAFNYYDEGYTKTKRIAARDLQSGRILSNTPAARNSQAFLMARSIGVHGIEPYPYKAKAFQETLAKHKSKLVEALEKDFLDGLND